MTALLYNKGAWTEVGRLGSHLIDAAIMKLEVKRGKEEENITARTSSVRFTKANEKQELISNKKFNQFRNRVHGFHCLAKFEPFDSCQFLGSVRV